MTGRVLLSLSWASPWRAYLADHPHPQVRTLVRRSDWNVSRRTQLLGALRDGIDLLRQSGKVDAVVCATTALDVLVAALVLRLRPRVTLAVWDLLLPRNPRVRRIARLVLRRVDVWVVIRTADSAIFHRELGAPATSAFVPFPAFPADPGIATSEEPYVYAAGTAWRDWATFLQAARAVESSFVISADPPVQVPEELGGRVASMPLLSPQEGRETAARASVVCIPFQETEFPSGPVVLLDAMLLGKAVVATKVNGSQDYIDDGVTGLLVEPRDPGAMASAIRALQADPELRRSIGSAAQRRMREDFSPETVIRRIVAVALANRRTRRTGSPRTARGSSGTGETVTSARTPE